MICTPLTKFEYGSSTNYRKKIPAGSSSTTQWRLYDSYDYIALAGGGPDSGPLLNEPMALTYNTLYFITVHTLSYSRKASKIAAGSR
jgi:hypothetical protein